METELKNTVSAKGNYNNIPTSITSTTSVVTMIDGLTITKTANKLVWVSDNLIYTIIVNNQTEKIYESPIVTDILDDNLIEFVNDSVTIDEVEATSSEYNYNDATHTLTINLENIEPSTTKTIKFQVRKKS